MSILLLGAHGQLGTALRKVFPGAVPVTRAEVDLTDARALMRLLDTRQPSVVINAAAHTAVDRAEDEPGLSFRLNAEAPGVMAAYAARHGATLVHVSTDYVFDGTKARPYVEDDAPAPLNVYGHSKLAGERQVARMAGGARWYILRTSWLYGSSAGDSPNFIRTMLRLASQRDSLRVVADQHGTPTAAAWLAQVIAALLADPVRVPPGLYHAVPSGATTWHGLATLAIEEARRLGLPLRLPPGAIEPIATDQYPTPAPRPANSRLDNGRLADLLGAELFSDWQPPVTAYVRELVRAQRPERLGLARPGRARHGHG